MSAAIRKAHYEVQEYNGGFAGFLVVSEVTPLRTDIVLPKNTKPEVNVIKCERKTKVYGDSRFAAKALNDFVQDAHSKTMSDFRKQQ